MRQCEIGQTQRLIGSGFERRIESVSASTRMLTGPDSLEIVAAEVGVERLLLGCRTPLHETHAVVRRLLTSKLTPDEIAQTGSRNLRTLLEPA